VKRIEESEFEFHICNEKYMLVDMVLRPGKWARANDGDILEVPLKDFKRWHRDGTLSAFLFDTDLLEAVMPRAHAMYYHLRSEYSMYLSSDVISRKRGFKAHLRRWLNPAAEAFDDVRKVLVKESFTYLSAKLTAVDLLARVEPFMPNKAKGSNV
jgi:hypothetical protein